MASSSHTHLRDKLGTADWAALAQRKTNKTPVLRSQSFTVEGLHVVAIENVKSFPFSFFCSL